MAEPLDPADLEALRALIADVDRATHEIARLSHEDDRGSGERTARMSSLGAWETNRARLLERIETMAGGADLDAVRTMLDAR